MARVLVVVYSVADEPLRSAGFERIDERRWVRMTKEPIREVISVTNARGMILMGAGMALPFVPRLTGRRVGWTSKPEKNGFGIGVATQSRISAEYRPVMWEMQATKEKVFETIRRAVPVWIRQFLDELNQIQGLPDVRRELDEHFRLRAHEVETLSPDMHLARVFTLAAVGEHAKASQGLEHFLKLFDDWLWEAQIEKLRKMLAETKRK
jgi:hypothetical protein